MSAPDFDRLCEEVRQLSLPELRRLRNVVNAILANPALLSDKLTKREAVLLGMLASGMLESIPPPPTEEDIKRFEAYKPIEVQGEPVSETIIRERR